MIWSYWLSYHSDNDGSKLHWEYYQLKQYHTASNHRGVLHGGQSDSYYTYKYTEWIKKTGDNYHLRPTESDETKISTWDQNLDGEQGRTHFSQDIKSNIFETLIGTTRWEFHNSDFTGKQHQISSLISEISD